MFADGMTVHNTYALRGVHIQLSRMQAFRS